MVIQKTPPGLGWFFASLLHQTGDCALRDFKAQFEKFPMYSRCAPEDVGGGHGPDQLANLSTHWWTSRSFCLRQSPPISFESFALPGDHRFRSNDDQSGFPVLPNRPQPNPKQAIPTVQPRTFNVSLEHGQLLPKCRIFQGDLSMTTEHKNDESNPDENCIQHEKTTLPPSDGRINGLRAYGVFGEGQVVPNVGSGLILGFGSRRANCL